MRPRVVVAALLLMLALLLIFASLLAWGNPQWGYLVYIFQADVFPGSEPPIPAGYTGTWKTWWRCGGVKEEIGVVEGVRSGSYTLYGDNGAECVTGAYKNGKEDGTWVSWSDDGRRESERGWKEGMNHGKFTEWDEHGKVAASGWMWRRQLLLC